MARVEFEDLKSVDIINGYAEVTPEFFKKYGEYFDDAINASLSKVNEVMEAAQQYTKSKQLDELALFANKFCDTVDKIAKLHYEIICGDGGAVDSMTRIKEATVPNIAEQGAAIKASMEWTEKSYKKDFPAPNGSKPILAKDWQKLAWEMSEAFNVFNEAYDNEITQLMHTLESEDALDFVVVKIAVPYRSVDPLLVELSEQCKRLDTQQQELVEEHKSKGKAMYDDLEAIAKTNESKFADELDAEFSSEIGSLE